MCIRDSLTSALESFLYLSSSLLKRMMQTQRGCFIKTTFKLKSEQFLDLPNVTLHSKTYKKWGRLCNTQVKQQYSNITSNYLVNCKKLLTYYRYCLPTQEITIQNFTIFIH